MPALYDTIGVNYAHRRRPDPRIAGRIRAALGDAQSVVNFGAGAGNYEPHDIPVTALEPSAEMIAQRPAEAAPCVQGRAEAAPFETGAFDAAMGVLTVHHWTDKPKGLAEMARVARSRVVILTFDPACRDFWLLDYLPDLAALDDKIMPPMTDYADALGPVRIDPVPIPHDCVDGFLAAHWRRPETYLDPAARAAISSFHKLGLAADGGLARLAADLKSGDWRGRYGDLMSKDEIDVGYRLVTAERE